MPGPPRKGAATCVQKPAGAKATRSSSRKGGGQQKKGKGGNQGKDKGTSTAGGKRPTRTRRNETSVVEEEKENDRPDERDDSVATDVDSTHDEDDEDGNDTDADVVGANDTTNNAGTGSDGSRNCGDIGATKATSGHRPINGGVGSQPPLETVHAVVQNSATTGSICSNSTDGRRVLDIHDMNCGVSTSERNDIDLAKKRTQEVLFVRYKFPPKGKRKEYFQLELMAQLGRDPKNASQVNRFRAYTWPLVERGVAEAMRNKRSTVTEAMDKHIKSAYLSVLDDESTSLGPNQFFVFSI